MAVLKSIEYRTHNLHSLLFDAPPYLTSLDADFPDGYLTGLSGVESLPVDTILSSKALGGSYFHGFNVLDREVVLTFKPSGTPGVVRSKINSIRQANGRLEVQGMLRFKLYSEETGVTRSFEGLAVIADFESNLFGESTESRITFKMPEPHFVETPLDYNALQFVADEIMTFSITNGVLKIERNLKDEEKHLEMGELLYTIIITVPTIKKGDILKFGGNFSVEFYESVKKPTSIEFGVEANGRTLFRASSAAIQNGKVFYSTKGFLPRIFPSPIKMHADKEHFMTVGGTAKISSAEISYKAMSIEGF